jgi:hypothetical protein
MVVTRIAASWYRTPTASLLIFKDGRRDPRQHLHNKGGRKSKIIYQAASRRQSQEVRAACWGGEADLPVDVAGFNLLNRPGMSRPWTKIAAVFTTPRNVHADQ